MREGERARRDLLLGAVGRDEDVGCRKQIGDLVDAQEPVVELDVALETEVEHRPLERHPVALPLAMRDVGVRPAGDDVEHVRVLLDDRRQRLDHRLEPLAGGDQAERREQEAVVEPTGRASRARRLAQRSLDRELARAAGEHAAARRAARPGPSRTGRSRRRRAGCAPCPSSRSRARPGGRRRRARSPDGASAPTAPCAGSRRAAGSAPRRATRRSSPSRPPKMPYSCCSRTTSISSRPRMRAART